METGGMRMTRPLPIGGVGTQTPLFGSLTDLQLTPRQRELASLLAALLVADYKAFPPASDNSAAGHDRNRSEVVTAGCPQPFNSGVR